MARLTLKLLSAGVVCVIATSLSACGAEDDSPDTSRDHEVSSTNTRSGPGFGDKSLARARDEGAAIGGGLKALTADYGCTASHPHYVGVFQGGFRVPGLYECVDTAGVSTEVHNTSNDLVWSLTAPTNFLYWTAEDSSSEPLAVQIFREAMRSGHTDPTRPAITLEPGSVTTIPAGWAAIRMDQHAGVQVAWKSITTAVGTIQTNALDEVENLITEGSLTRKAVVTCAKNGYELGKALADASEQPTQTPSEQLALVFGIGNNLSECRRDIKEAAAYERAQGKAAALTLDDLRIKTQDLRWQARVNLTVRRALAGLLAVARRG